MYPGTLLSFFPFSHDHVDDKTPKDSMLGNMFSGKFKIEKVREKKRNTK